MLNVELKELPKTLFYVILVLYPVFCMAVTKGSEINARYLFGFICIIVLIVKLITVYKSGENLYIPNYIVWLALFTIFVSVSSFFLTDELKEEGLVKYLYSNDYIPVLISFTLIENLTFSQKWIDNTIKVLIGTILLAAVVSIIQISNPLFLHYDNSIVEGLSYERILEYYKANPELETSSVDRTLDKGYRESIYSYITSISVGVDNLALLSILIALKMRKRGLMLLLIVAAALVSFLSNARWAMLNFVIIASQQIWFQKNKLVTALKYGFFAISLLLISIPALEFVGIDTQKFVEDRLLDNSASTRLLAVEVFSKVFPDSPIVGTGGVTTDKVRLLLRGRSSQIHVGYLKLFYYYGLIGGLLFLFFLGSLLIRLWKMAKQSGYWGGFFAILAFAVMNLTLVEFNMFYYGLILSLIFSKHYSEKSEKLKQVKNFDYAEGQILKEEI